MKLRWALPCLLTLLLGCDTKQGGAEYVDAAWHRKDLDAHITRWLAVAPTPSGMLRGQFSRSWEVRQADVGDLTLHSRLIYAMVVGYEATGDKRYLDAAKHGTAFLLEQFHDPLHGGYYRRVDAQGKVLNDAKNAYGHAFALLALSHMARVTAEPKYRAAALTTWREIKQNLVEPGGGLLADTGRDFAHGGGGLRSQNPVMHMFEALLALVQATDDAGARADAQALGDFVVRKLMVGLPNGDAYIPEYYNEQWQQVDSKDKGGYTDIGHQYEWVHLLRTAERRGLPPIYSDVAERLLTFAIEKGYDDAEGGIFNRLFPDGSVDRDKYWWPQAEAMRAFLSVGERPDMARRYRETLELVDKEFLDPANGGWRLGDKRTCASGNCEGGQPDPYHLVGLDWAALAMVPGARK